MHEKQSSKSDFFTRKSIVIGISKLMSKMRVKTQQQCKALFSLTVFMICLLTLAYRSQRSQNEDDGGDDEESSQCPFWLALTEIVKSCVVSNLQPPIWNSLNVAVSSCSSLLFKTLKVELLSNKDDVKGFIPFVRPQLAVELGCTELTLGIGGDILSEQKLQERLPNCSFFGADPIAESGKIFEQLPGKYFQIAVGSKTGLLNASVLLNPNDIFNYKNQPVKTVSIVEFVKMTKLKQIDYLFLDAEGAEYELIANDLHRQSQLMAVDKQVICQLNVELHGPIQRYGIADNDQWDKVVRDFIVNSNFLPVWAPPAGNHQRVFFINTRSRACIHKFYSHFCFK